MSRALQDYCSAFDDVFLHLPGGVRRRSEAEIDAMGLNDFKQAVAKMILCETGARLWPAGGPRRGARIEARLAFGHARRHFPIMLNGSQCSAVERIPGKVSGVWLFKGTRVPVQALFENLESGATVQDFLEWFPGVAREQVEAVLEHAQRSLVET